MASLRSSTQALRSLAWPQARKYSSAATPQTSPFAPRHLLSIADLTPAEFSQLVRNAHAHKTVLKAGDIPKALQGKLNGKTVAMPFSKRSSRTRVSTEGAVVIMGGHPMFLSSADIQLGVNESVRDTSIMMSSMVNAIVARVGPHSDVADLAKYSSVPVINALSDLYHPLQTIADYLTIMEAFQAEKGGVKDANLGLAGMKIAWVGDANNVLFDLAIASAKLGVQVSVATPEGYGIPDSMREIITSSASDSQWKLHETHEPLEAVKNADILVTDTWVSMGQEEETARRLKAFEGYQISSEMAAKGGAKEGWKFMHCLPRHPEEVSDEVFYGDRSLVFPEAENRLYSAISALEAFVVNKGKIV